jgi:hypothetical protein
VHSSKSVKKKWIDKKLCTKWKRLFTPQLFQITLESSSRVHVFNKYTYSSVFMSSIQCKTGREFVSICYCLCARDSSFSLRNRPTCSYNVQDKRRRIGLVSKRLYIWSCRGGKNKQTRVPFHITGHQNEHHATVSPFIRHIIEKGNYLPVRQ